MPWPVPDYGAVRALLDVSLSAAALPDATLQGDVFLGGAQADVLAVDADAAGYASATPEQARVKLALEYFLAARVAPAWRAKVQQSWQQGRYSYTLPAWDGAARAAELRALAAAVLAGNLETPSSLLAGGFGLAKGGRWR